MSKPTKRKRPPALACPTCGAKAGDPCVATSGAIKPDLHVARQPAKQPPTPAERDCTRAPRYARWAAAQPGGQVFDAAARARFIEALAADGRLAPAIAIARVSTSSVARWRKAGAAQLAAMEKHETAQDRLAAADPGHQRQPYPGAHEAADFVLDMERARAWWEAQHQHRLQQLAEDTEDPRWPATTMFLLNRHDRITGAVKGGEVHEHHHHEPTGQGLMGKMEEIIKRRAALRGDKP